MFAVAPQASHVMEQLMSPGKSQSGFTLLWVLLAMALLGLSMAKAGEHWGLESKRQAEAELLRVGSKYARAIASYRAAAPGSVVLSPRSLEALLQDDRYPRTVRHLRRLWPDPVAPHLPWGLVQDDEGRVIGVYSQSSERPFSSTEVVLAGAVLPAAQRYSDWKFLGTQWKEKP
jgi:type II secretory pathway pseudopilin PulG